MINMHQRARQRDFEVRDFKARGLNWLNAFHGTSLKDKRECKSSLYVEKVSEHLRVARQCAIQTKNTVL